MLCGKRGVHIVTAGLLTFLVVVSISIATYYLVSTEIERTKQGRNVDLLRDSMLTLYSRARGIRVEREGHVETFSLSIPAGTLRIDPDLDLVNLTVVTDRPYNPGGTDYLNVTDLPGGGVAMTMRLPVDAVTQNTRVGEGRYTASLVVEAVKNLVIGNWTLNTNVSAPTGVSTASGNWYSSVLPEATHGVDLNGDGDRGDLWYVYVSDPGEEYVFDTAVLHDSLGNPLETVLEGDTFRLGVRPLAATTVRERKVVFRYVRVSITVE